MNRLDEWFVLNEEQRCRIREIGKLADSFAVGAHRTDAEHGFSYEHIEALRNFGYCSYTVPKEYGGEGISIYELVLYQERLAQGDAAISLGVGWHLGVMFELNYKQQWARKEALAYLNQVVAKTQRLVNRAATEKASGSPTRGGMPLTVAQRQADGTFILNGRKTFTTLSPVLDYYIVTADLDGQIAEFLIPRNTAGVSVELTWQMAGMRGTASHDLVMEQALLPMEAHVHTLETRKGAVPAPYLLHIPACYLGIALAARKEAIKFASAYQPNSLTQPIIYLPNIVQQLGQIELELQAARHFIYSAARRWDEQALPPQQLASELSAAKVIAIQAAMSVVDKAMRIVGAHSLSLEHPLQRMYRDVRFGLHNPPMEDAVVGMLGKLAIEDFDGENQ